MPDDTDHPDAQDTAQVVTLVPMPKTDGTGLTQKQIAFCSALVSGGDDGLGMTQTDAHRAAGYGSEKMSDKCRWEEASKLMATPKVAQRVKALRRRAEDSVLHSGLSLRGVVARELLGLSLNPTDDDGVELPDQRRKDSDRIAALRQLGSLAHVGAFVERHAEVDEFDTLTEEEQLEEIERRLRAAFEKLDRT